MLECLVSKNVFLVAMLLRKFREIPGTRCLQHADRLERELPAVMWMPENIKVFRNFQQIVKLIFHKITLKRGIFTYHSGTIEAGVDIGFAGI
jgi:hypothetical protein